MSSAHKYQYANFLSQVEQLMSLESVTCDYVVKEAVGRKPWEFMQVQPLKYFNLQ